MKLITREVLRRILGAQYTLEKSSGEKYTIQCEIQSITTEDVKFGSYGVWDIGNLRGFFLPYYEIEGETVTVEEDDILYVGDERYRVERIIRHLFRGEEVFREALLERII